MTRIAAIFGVKIKLISPCRSNILVIHLDRMGADVDDATRLESKTIFKNPKSTPRLSYYRGRRMKVLRFRTNFLGSLLFYSDF